jgi:hypothetical protein
MRRVGLSTVNGEYNEIYGCPFLASSDVSIVPADALLCGDTK